MNSCIIFILLSIFSETSVPSSNGELAKSQYNFYCLGATEDALTAARRSAYTPQRLVLESRILHATKQVEVAVDLLVSYLQKSRSGEGEALTDSLLMMRPEYSLPLILEKRIRVGSRMLRDMTRQGLALKEGVLFERLVKPHDRKQVVAYRIHSLTGRGLVLRQFGFEVGDEIYRVDGRSVTTLGFGDALSIASKLGEGRVLKIMIRRLGEPESSELEFMFESDASLALAHHEALGREGVH